MNLKFNCRFSAILLFAVLGITQISLAQSESFEKNPEKGIVYLYRPGRAVGALVKTQIRVNGQEAGGTSNNSYFKWELEPGRYTFSCYTKGSSPVVELQVEANEHYFIRQDERVGLTEGGRVTLKVENEKKGKKAVSNCKQKLISTYPAN